MAYINFDKAAELFITVRKGDDFQMSLTNVQIDGVNITSSRVRRSNRAFNVGNP
jgi:hypothetical protein